MAFFREGEWYPLGFDIRIYTFEYRTPGEKPVLTKRTLCRDCLIRILAGNTISHGSTSVKATLIPNSASSQDCENCGHYLGHPLLVSILEGA